MLDWYDKNKRPLPWRENKDPYEIWVSEIMCQQTRVDAVKPYFASFLSELPTVEALAACPQQRLMKLWEGLGYYNRVRNMQKAAQQVMERYHGELPADYEALKGLQGIGNYTAGAIASIAYGVPVPAVDGNVLRVIARLTEWEEDIAKQSARRRIEQQIQEIIPKGRPGDYNQALMELGALVCIPNGQARCGQCPLEGLCLARIHGTADQFPVKSGPKPRKIEERTVLVILDGNRAAIRKRDSKGLLAGLYELPNVQKHLTEDEALEWAKSLGLTPLHIRYLGEARHIFSHVEWRMLGYQIRIQQLEGQHQGDMVFAEQEEIRRTYAIPLAFDAFAGYIGTDNRRKS